MKKRNSLSTALPVAMLIAATAAVLPLGCGSGAGGRGAGSGCTSVDFTPNYAEFIGLSRLRYWAFFPVTVFFKNEVVVDRGNGQFTNLSDRIREGLQAWESAIGGIEFVEVASEGQADVVFQINVLAAEPGVGEQLGVTTVSFDPGTKELSHADVEINAWNGMTLSNVDVDIPQTSAHEIGHALGVGGHSDDEDDLMFPSAPEGTPTLITTRDRNTMRTAYCDSFLTQAQTRRSRTAKSLVTETMRTLVGGCVIGAAPAAHRVEAVNGRVTAR